MNAQTADLDLFAVTAPGLESLCAAELRVLGIPAEPDAGGASWRGDLRSLYRANLESRTATRVLVRAGTFRARTFHELERRSAKLPWARFLPAGASVSLRVTCRKSKLYHAGAVAERVARVLADGRGVRVVDASNTADDDGIEPPDVVSTADAPPPGTDASQPPLVVIRLLRDVCTVSIDSSGVLLHRRGYRQALAKAPLRETLAAALLLAARWRGVTPLLDPLCGSGTIPIEAALLARRIPPGLANPDLAPRSHAFEQWPEFDAGVWSDTLAAARDGVLEAAPAPILGSDRDAGAVAAAITNARRAGVERDVDLTRRALSAVEPPGGRGHLVTNPPYGVRVGDHQALYALYAALGRTARERLPGWTVALLTADARLTAATGLALEERLATRNGGIAVRLMSAHIGR